MSIITKFRKWARDRIRPLLIDLVPCPCCEGHKRERYDFGGNLGPVEIPCYFCGGEGSWRAYRAKREADIAVINDAADL